MLVALVGIKGCNPLIGCMLRGGGKMLVALVGVKGGKTLLPIDGCIVEGGGKMLVALVGVVGVKGGKTLLPIDGCIVKGGGKMLVALVGVVGLKGGKTLLPIDGCNLFEGETGGNINDGAFCNGTPCGLKFADDDVKEDRKLELVVLGDRGDNIDDLAGDTETLAGDKGGRLVN